MLLQAWLLEIAKAFGKLFLNPLFYWIIILIVATGYFRIKRERGNFGVKIFNLFSEWKNTWILSISASIILSLLMLGVGFVFTKESILLLMIVVILLSITFRTSLLSASYTIGITFLLLLGLPYVLQYQTYVSNDLFSSVNFTGFAILLGFFLFVEAMHLANTDRNETFPGLSVSYRGIWIGHHHIRKVSFIPFFVLTPSGLITPFADYWPYFSLGETSYSLLLVPFIIGYDHLVRAYMVEEAAKKLSKSVSLLAIIVTVLAICSIYIPWLTLVAVVLAIVGREFITYKQRIDDKEKTSYFNKLDEGLRVLAIIPGTPAARLDILVGEKIVKVNGRKINSSSMFYEALQESGSFFKLDVIDDAGEVRFIQSAFYEGDHHKLGLVFTDSPYIEKRNVQ